MIHAAHFFQTSNGGSGGTPPVQNNSFQVIPDNGDGYASSSTDYVSPDMAPISGYYNRGMGCWIITSAEMGAAKQLTGMQFKQYDRSGDGSYTMQNQFIRIAHCSESTLPSGTLEPTGSSAATLSMSNHLTLSDETIVHNNGSWAISDTSNDSYSSITFDTSNFVYNGTDNIVIFWVSNWGTYSSGYQWFHVNKSSSNNNKGGWVRSDYTSITSQTFTRKDIRPVMKFNY